MLVDLQWNPQAYMDAIKSSGANIEIIRLESIDGGLDFVGNYICPIDGEKTELDFTIIHLFTGCYGTEGNFHNFINQYSDNTVLNWPSLNYGSADTVEQILAHHTDLISDPLNKYVLSVKLLMRETDGDWRWHKNGEYIGDRQPMTEYLGDEPEIDEVLMYEFIEVRDPQS